MNASTRFPRTAPLPRPTYAVSPTPKTKASNSRHVFLSHSDTEDSEWEHQDHHFATASPRRVPRHTTSHNDSALSPERPQSIAQKRQQTHQLQLERTNSGKTPRPVNHDPPANESPNAWFQRIMRAKQLSPLDLCDLFSYGDARRHQTVPLSHVCDVLFALDPEVAARGHDPVTPEMEAFLYAFAFENDDSDGTGGGTEREIVVSVKDALRSLDIWRSSVASPSPALSTSNEPAPTMSPAKSTVLEAKNKQLQSVIASLQSANVRLSQQLDDAARQQQSAASTTAPRSPQPTRAEPFQAPSTSLNSMFLGSSSSVSSASERPALHATSAVANQHEDALVKIANRLQYPGVKRLEELLVQGDRSLSVISNDSAATAVSTPPCGFVTLKQLRWLLAEHFHLAITETELMESCLGMNFSTHATLDYREFVHVLLDILVYAFPAASSARKQPLYKRIHAYFDSGFGTRPDTSDKRHHREVLARLCEKYDLAGDRQLSVADIMRVFYEDLARLHALGLAFPLPQQDAICVLQPFVCELTTPTTGDQDANTSITSTSGVVSYPELVDALFGDIGNDTQDAHGTTPAPDEHPALTWAFWAKLRKALCGGNLAVEPTVHAQLCKIFKKLDPAPRRFLVSRRTFARVLDQHVGITELEALASALAINQTSVSGSSAEAKRPNSKPPATSPPPVPLLRFDVFMKLVFGAPALQDSTFLRHHVVAILALNETRIRARVAELLLQRGGDWKLSPSALFALLTSDNKSSTHSKANEAASSSSSRELTVAESLYLFALLNDDHAGQIELKTLWTFLKTECDRTSEPPGDSQRPCRSTITLESTRQTLVRCMDGYDLEHALAGFKTGPHSGRVSQDELLKAIDRMFAALGLDTHSCETLDPASLQQLLATIAVETNDADPELLQSGRLHLPIAVDAFFDALFDWDAVVRALKLPQHLVEAKRALELFDWHKDGSVSLEDWNRAWRVACPGSARGDMAEWERRVLQRRFPATAGCRGSRLRKEKRANDASGIDYARLLVHLLDAQQQRARERLKDAVVAHFRGLFAASSGRKKLLSAQRAETLFRQIVTDDKGHFNMRDLHVYLTNTLSETDRKDDNGGELSLENVTAVAQVLGLVTGSRDSDRSATATTVMRTRFHDVLQSIARLPSPLSALPMDCCLSPRKRPNPRVVTNLRELELVVLTICRDVASDGSVVLPTRAFRYLSGASSPDLQTSRRRSQSPTLKRGTSRSRSPVRSQPGDARTVGRQATATLKPLTAARLQRVLLERHELRVSTLIVSQFFKHIGASSASDLALLAFAQWVAPLTAATEATVRAVARQMVVRSKGGGGRVDLDRFLAQLHRKLLDALEFSVYADDSSGGATTARRVSPALLLSKLKLLSIPLTRHAMDALRRHFGMEEDTEVDVALFLERIVELSAQLGSRE